MDTEIRKANINELPNKEAYTINAYAPTLPDDNYYNLMKESASILVAQGYGDASYVGGWRTSTIWDRGKQRCIIVRPSDRNVITGTTGVEVD